MSVMGIYLQLACVPIMLKGAPTRNPLKHGFQIACPITQVVRQLRADGVRPRFQH
jgi:hypothetical protein